MGDEYDGAIEDLTISNPGRQVHWIRYNETSDDDDDDDDNKVVTSKVASAFLGVKSFPFRRIYFQLWRMRKAEEDGTLVLDTYRNPYAQMRFDRLLHKYRSRSVKYLYRIKNDDNNNSNSYPFRMLNCGLPATAFLNHFPEVVFDLKVHQGSPLVDTALECDLTSCIMLPIFQSSQSQCVGVVECSVRHPSLLLPIFNEMKHELERHGLSIYYVQGNWPYKTITGDLEPAKIEIQKGLKMAYDSHDLTLGQVWISYETQINDHHASDSADQMTRKLLVKLSGYCAADSNDHDPLSSVKDFYDKLDVLSLKEGEGLVWKTLQTHQPYFCRNIHKLSDYSQGVLGVLSANTKSRCTCLVICLRSTHTGGLDYALEFFWPQRRNHMILVEALLLTLGKYLPSFKFASGEQLGDEIHVVDVSPNTPLKILQGNQLSETYSSVGVKRKSIDTYALTNINNPEGEDEDGDLSILAFYRNDATLFFLPISSTFENLMVKLNMEFELDPAVDYQVEHEVLPGEWCILECLESCRRTMKDTGLVKLYLVASNGEVAWQWKTNS